MKSNFVDRLLSGVVGKEQSARIRPAVTPDVLPESFRLPDILYPSEQRSVESRVESRFDSDLRDDSTKESGSSISEKVPTEESSNTVEDAAPSRDKLSKEDDTRLRGISHKVMGTKAGQDNKRPEGPIGTAKLEDEASVKMDIKADSQELGTRKIRGRIFDFTETPRDLKHDEEGQIPVEIVPSRIFTGFAKAYGVSQSSRALKAVQHSEPVVTIKIGRIEVRAVMPEKPAPKTQQFPPLSLKEYLRQRSEERL